jgi:amino acid transporter
MNNRDKIQFAIITLLFAIPAFLLARVIWPFPQEPADGLRTFFTVVTAFESIFTGIGVAFVAIVLIKFRRSLRRKGAIGWLSFVSLAWILISGYFHDNSHLAHSTDLHGLVPIEIFFHGTLAVAALILAVHFIQYLER